MKRALFPLLAAAATAATPAVVFAASPDLNDIMPRGAQRGTTVEVVFTGARLQDAAEIISYSPGFTVAELKAENPTTVKAKLTIPADCAFGEHLFRVRCASGLSYARSFWVGQFPTVDEKEPNTQFSEAQPVTSGVTVAGIAKNEDVDYYKLDAKKGERISVEVEGIRLGNVFWDPYVAILNSKKFELATCDDSALLVQDAHASVIAPEDGTYIVEVRDSSYAGRDNAHYRLHIGGFPRPTTVYPSGGKAGAQVEVTYLGDAGGPIKEIVTVPNTPGEMLPLFAKANGLTAPSPNPFRITSLDNVLEAEPNNSHAEAKEKQTAVPAVPAAFNGVIEKADDTDWFKFSAKKDQRLDLMVYSRGLRSPLDPVLELFNKDGGGINGNDDNGPNPDSKIGGWVVPEDGEYYIRVRDHLMRGGADFVYRVEISAPEPSMNSYITRFDRVDSQMRHLIPVARGNRYATLINVDRANVGGDVIWDIPNLPAGVTLESDPLPAGLGQYAVVFAAAADAPNAAGLLKIRPKFADEKVVAPGKYSQNIEFVQGEPNTTPYVTSTQNVMALAVTDEVPFTLEIVKPTVPLVQSGTIDLKVKAVRKEGFKAPITVRMMWNPPGVSSPGTIAIPEGQSEGTYTMTANGDAQVKTWRITMLGETDAGAGPIYAASPLTELTVAPPYLTMKMEMGTAEQGKPGEILCTLETTKPFEGTAKVNLYGLPAKVTTVEKEIKFGDKEVRFPITTVADSPTGKHTNLFCQAIIVENGVGIPHTIGQGGVLRVDAPPPAPAAPPPAAAAVVAEAPKPAEAPAAKPLSRLEQLRQQAAAK